MRAYRYQDGVLIACQEVHPVLRLPWLDPLDLFFPTVDHEKRVDVGIYAADLAREARKPGGPPVWFRPNLSRRKRWVEWTSKPRRPHQAEFASVRVETLLGHRIRGWAPAGAAEPGAERAVGFLEWRAPGTLATAVRDANAARGPYFGEPARRRLAAHLVHDLLFERLGLTWRCALTA
jgi:hypothetical protein